MNCFLKMVDGSERSGEQRVSGHQSAYSRVNTSLFLFPGQKTTTSQREVLFSKRAGCHLAGSLHRAGFLPRGCGALLLPFGGCRSQECFGRWEWQGFPKLVTCPSELIYLRRFKIQLGSKQKFISISNILSTSKNCFHPNYF